MATSGRPFELQTNSGPTKKVIVAVLALIPRERAEMMAERPMLRDAVGQDVHSHLA